jgi:hypothetical protein
MIHIKRFVDKITLIEGKQGRDVVIPIGEARGLRDELTKLLADNYELLQNKTSVDPVFQVEMNGGRF